MCSQECIRFCPRVRTGDETIVMGEDGKPVISEELCIGCVICTKKCPFGAIMIIGLPDELGDPVHRYGVNGFSLYGLPVPVEGRITGILGPNGIGKSTAVNILSGNLLPNLGRENTRWEDVLERYRASTLHDYFKSLRGGEVRTAIKPQYIDRIPRHFQGVVSKLLERTDERGVLSEILEELELTLVVERDLASLSGGELQRVALAACAARDADLYFIDEVSPYLDIYQRIKAARLIRGLAEAGKAVIVVEHDLAILDLLADHVHIAYGMPGAYGVITHPKGIRVGINQYLRGYLPEENIRIRPQPVEFEVHAPLPSKDIEILFIYPGFTKSYSSGFTLRASGGSIRRGEVMGILGPNGTGKSTFMKILAGETRPDQGELETGLKISYKPQYLQADQSMRVDDFLRSITRQYNTSYYQTEILKPLQLDYILDHDLTELSGGELQRVAIAACLSQTADLYLLDEPSAHLDVEQRMMATKTIRRFAENNHVTAMVIDHDIYMIDLLSDRLLVFEGTPTQHGEVHGPFEMRPGMNRFLKSLGITFRRDEETKRPRVNKPGSKLDRQQRAEGEYYYLPVK